jgi:peptide chain release factor subunit 1
MISQNDIETLAKRQAKPGSPVLSVYLDTDQSREINIERGFEIVLKDLLREIRQKLDQDKQEEFDKDAARVRQYTEAYRDLKRGLVIFCDDSEDFFWVSNFNVRVHNRATWDETPYLRPLVEMLDEYERYGVVLADREKARLFTVYLGEIEEHLEAFAEADVTHIKSSGMDHLRSQMNIERKADEHAHWHLKRVADLMSRLAQKHEFDRLVLAGQAEVTSELSGLLPKALRTRVVRQMPMPMHVSDAYVLAETLKVEQEVEREREAELVKGLITAAGKHDHAVLNLTPTVKAIQEWRVWELVYAEGFSPKGSQCVNCGALYAEEKSLCDYCAQEVRPVNDFVDRAIARVLDMQGKVEQVAGPAAERLQEVGSIGALLRY